MNWNERETRFNFALQCGILVCCALGAFSFLSMSRRNKALIDQVGRLSVLVESQDKLARKQSEMATIQSETNRNLSAEIKDIRRRQDILRRVAERIGIESAFEHKKDMDPATP